MRQRPNHHVTRVLVLTFLLAPNMACDESSTTAPAPIAANSAAMVPRSDANISVAAVPTGSYRASLGTLPEAQGWTYGGDNGNPSPFVSQGVLIENTTVGEQYWRRVVPTTDFSKHFAFEARIKVIASNYVPNIGTGAREGYYFAVTDSTSGYGIGLADAGFNINSGCAPNQPLTPYPLADGKFHEFRFRVAGGKASLSIDGVVVANNVTPDPFTHCFSPPAILTFGAVAGVSRSVTELKDFVFRAW